MEVGRIIFFEDKNCLRLKECGQAVLVTENIKDGLELKEKGFDVRFLDDFFSMECIEEGNRECLSFINSIISLNDKNILLEYDLTPHFIRIFRQILGLGLLFKELSCKDIVVIKSGRFTDLSAEYLKQNSLSFKCAKPDFFKLFLCKIKKLKRGKETKWLNTGIRFFLLEPFWLGFLTIAGQFKKIGKKNDSLGKSSDKKTLVFTGDRFTSALYKELRKEAGWDFILAGKTYPGRKIFMAEKISWIEEWSSPMILIKNFLNSKSRLKWRNFKKEMSGRFLYKNVNFWNLSKGYLRNLFFITLPLMNTVYESASRSFKGKKAALLLSTDVIDYNRALYFAARDNKIPSLMVQHGFLLESNAHSKVLADKVAGWGKASVDWYGRLGNSPDKIIITGNPKFDSIRTIEEKSKTGGKKIILVGTDFTTDFSIDESDLKNPNMINAVIKAVGDRNDFGIVIKIHPGESISAYKDFIDKHPGITVTNGDFYEALATCDILVMNYSSAVLEAAIFQKPTIVFKNHWGRKLAPVAEWGIAEEVENCEQMRRAIARIADGASEQVQIMENRKKFIEYYAYKIDGQSTRRVLDAVKSLYRGR